MLRQADLMITSWLSRTTSRTALRSMTGRPSGVARTVCRRDRALLAGLLDARFDRGLWLGCSSPESASDGPVLTGHLVDDDPDTVAGLPRPAACLEEYVCQPARKRRLLFRRPSREHLYGDHRHVIDTKHVIASGWREIGERVFVRVTQTRQTHQAGRGSRISHRCWTRLLGPPLMQRVAEPHPGRLNHRDSGARQARLSSSVSSSAGPAESR